MMKMRIKNARIVTRDEVIDSELTVEGGTILGLGTAAPADCEEIDFAGDYLLPGLVEIHTDNLEKNIMPRPGALWPSILAAAIAHDTQIIGSGITTVFDALAIGGLREGGIDARILDESIAAISQGQEQGLFKADHALHLRCEVSDNRMQDLLHKYGNDQLVRMISVMDHTPGQRQWIDLDKWRLYHRDKRWSDEQAEAIRQERVELQSKYAALNRTEAISFAHQRGIPLASHDDTTPQDAEESAAADIRISEFPTTLEAARVAQEKGMAIIMGSPNVIRGGSHSGNVSALELARAGLLDGLSSDYVPGSLLHAAFSLSEQAGIPLPKTVAMVSANVAALTGFHDRGAIEEGRRADLLQVQVVDGLPIVRRVWRQGIQVC